MEQVITKKFENETFYFALENGQIVVEGDNVRIGVGNLWEEEYTTDAEGLTQRGLRVGLWFFFREKPHQDRAVRMYEGQVLEIIGHQVRVVKINGENNSVVLGITQRS